MNFRNPIAFLTLTLLIFGGPGLAHALGAGTINRSEVAVQSEPNVKSEVLLQLSKGTKVEILEEKAGWLKIKVALDASFQFEGWVGSKFVTRKKPPIAKAVKPAPKTAATPRQATVVPTPVPTAAPPANPALDQFFETATSSKSTSSAAVAPSRASTPEQTTPPSFTEPATRRVPQGVGFVENLTDRASAR